MKSGFIPIVASLILMVFARPMSEWHVNWQNNNSKLNHGPEIITKLILYYRLSAVVLFILGVLVLTGVIQVR